MTRSPVILIASLSFIYPGLMAVSQAKDYGPAPLPGISLPGAVQAEGPETPPFDRIAQVDTELDTSGMDKELDESDVDHQLDENDVDTRLDNTDADMAVDESDVDRQLDESDIDKD